MFGESVYSECARVELVSSVYSPRGSLHKTATLENGSARTTYQLLLFNSLWQI